MCIGVLFTLACVVWGYLLYHKRENIVQLHIYIGALLIISFASYTINYIAYSVINTEGNHPPSIFAIGLVLSLTKNTFARLLGIFISKGFGFSR